MNATEFNEGDRVRLVRMADPYRDAAAHIGAEGTVLCTCPTPINVVTVEWDDGFGLNPCLDEDVIEKVGQ